MSVELGKVLEKEAYARVNSARWISLPPIVQLQWDPLLALRARRQAKRLANAGLLDMSPVTVYPAHHRQLIFSGGGNTGATRSLIEIVGSVHRAFMASSEHRRNILAPNFTRCGIGFAQSDTGEWYTCQIYRGRR